MKAIIKNGVLIDQDGFELYPNRVYLYGAGFKKIIKDYPDGTEVNISNCWDTTTLHADNAKVLYGAYMNFTFNPPETPLIDSPETNEQEVIINDPNVPFGKKGCDNNGVSRDHISNQSGGIPDSMYDSSIQNESNNAEGIQRLDSE